MGQQQDWFTADLHVGHQRIIHLCNRPFVSIAAMHAALIANWNERVAEDDDVYVVGDFAHRAEPEVVEAVFAALRGRKHLIIGNHDAPATLALPWASPPTHYLELKLGQRLVVLSHWPLRSWHRRGGRSIHLYGHTHGNLPPLGQSLDVGVDVWQFRPINLAEIRQHLQHIEHLTATAY